jgi:membrane protease YdiL (CAAX protease family)
MTELSTWLGGTLFQWGACVAISAPWIIVASGRKKTGNWRMLVWLAAFFLGCLLLVRLESIWSFLRSPWQAALLEISFALGVILLTRSGFAFGLTLKIDRQAWWEVIWITILFLLYVILRNNLLRMMGLANRAGTPGMEFLLYQATLPGIAEELAYRGVIQSHLNGIFGKPWFMLKTRLGWSFIITAVIFWAIHAFRVEGLALTFYWQTLTMQILAGVLYGWLRERSSSIVPGILAHNLVNLVWTLS